MPSLPPSAQSAYTRVHLGEQSSWYQNEVDSALIGRGTEPTHISKDTPTQYYHAGMSIEALYRHRFPYMHAGVNVFFPLPAVDLDVKMLRKRVDNTRIAVPVCIFVK